MDASRMGVQSFLPMEFKLANDRRGAEAHRLEASSCSGRAAKGELTASPWCAPVHEAMARPRGSRCKEGPLTPPCGLAAFWMSARVEPDDSPVFVVEVNAVQSFDSLDFRRSNDQCLTRSSLTRCRAAHFSLASLNSSATNDWTRLSRPDMMMA
jgi:hypothetical protein